MYDRAVPRDPERAGEEVDDEMSKAHLHCFGVGADATITPGTRQRTAPPPTWLEQGTSIDGGPGSSGFATGPTSIRGFALALDPIGFDPDAPPRPLADEEAFGRNNYIYRYLVRALPTADGTFIEGGMTHGMNVSGPMRDNARASALALRVDLTTFPGLDGAQARDIVWPARADDPNLLPEDGYVRWSVTRPADPEPACSPGW